MGSRRRTVSRMVRCGALAVSWLLASPALAATPVAFCDDGGSAALPHVTGADLVIAADRAEYLLAHRGSSTDDDAAIGAALDAAPPGDAPPDSAALARYCAAAGEWMRVAASGSQHRAQRFLLNALKYARAAGQSDIGARAAYRLGLASVSADASGATRGARGAENQQPAEAVDTPEPAGEDPCAALADAGALQHPGYFVTQSALRCAADRAGAAGDRPIAALARLRLARLALVRADRLPFAAAGLREQAAADARQGLAWALHIADPTLRATLVGRLADTSLDAGVDDAAAMLEATAAMRAATPGDRGTLALASALEGRLALAHGDRASAARALQMAVFLEGQRAQPLRHVRMAAAARQGGAAAAQALVLEAYQALQAVRPLLPAVDPVTEESTFALHMRPVFEAAVAVQLSVDPMDGDQAQIAAAQQIVEAYPRSRVTERVRVQLRAAVRSGPPRRPARRGDAALSDPARRSCRADLRGAERHWSSALRRLPASAPIKREDVARLVDDLVGSTSLGEDEEWREPARRLYDLLIKPIEGD